MYYLLLNICRCYIWPIQYGRGGPSKVQSNGKFSLGNKGKCDFHGKLPVCTTYQLKSNYRKSVFMILYFHNFRFLHRLFRTIIIMKLPLCLKRSTTLYQSRRVLLRMYWKLQLMRYNMHKLVEMQDYKLKQNAYAHCLQKISWCKYYWCVIYTMEDRYGSGVTTNTFK